VTTAGDYPQWPYPWHSPPRSKVILKADLIPAVSVLSFVALLGMAVGWIWSRLAPPQRMRILANGQVPLPVESYHRFDDLAVFVLLSLGAGLFTGFGVWLLRERRGPVIMVAAVLGSVAAAWLATKVGVSWAGSHFAVSGAPKVGDVVSKSPELESSWAILAWPLTTALAYGVLSAWNGMDDLGRRLA
jgi:xanthosine utilization system XapX-like protein